MLIKKVDIVNRAAEELRISGLTTNPTPNEVVSFVGRLDELMAQYQNDGLDCGYFFPSEYGESDVNDDSGLEMWMVRPVSMMLAYDIASSFGAAKAQAIDYQKVIKAMDSLSNGLVEVEGAKYPNTLPTGGANQYQRNDCYFYSGNEPSEE